jgi:hypothetical protein
MQCHSVLPAFALLALFPAALPAQMNYPATGNITQTWNQHASNDRAIDIANSTGTDVGSAYSGTVYDVVYLTTSYGRYLKVNHPSSYQTLYAHNSSVIVSEGQAVAQNQHIAEMGATGNATGPHSHFEIRRSGVFQYIPGSVGDHVVAGTRIPYTYSGLTESVGTYTIDNTAAGFTASANWSTGTSAADKLGTDYRFRATAALSDPASWTANVAAGTYNIYAWWSAGTNRSSEAPYLLPGDSAATAVNQQLNGGKWVKLGTKTLAAGAQTTKLSCWAPTGFVVIADGLRYGP